MFRGLFAIAATSLLGLLAHATKPILLIPLDDRPAAGQFAQMIGQIAGVTVELPPQELLGRFTQPGDSDRILSWIESKKPTDFSAVVLSTDMLAYGGLISSRTPEVSFERGLQRMRRFQKWSRVPNRPPIYAFSAVTRLSPTALQSTKSWRDALSKLAVIRSRLESGSNKEDLADLERIKKRIPEREVSRYYLTRARNHALQKELCRMLHAGVFNYLVMGQDDAQPVGPQVSETTKLKKLTTDLKINKFVFFCEGIDQHSNVLVSRALLAAQKWKPSVRVVYSDDGSRTQVGAYETKQIENSLRDQIIASGAKIAERGEAFDYSLYVNAPNPRPFYFMRWLKNLDQEIDQGLPVALADIDLGKTGTGNPFLFESVVESGRAKKLLSYAGWNTAGNTLGTAIPAANVYLAARQTPLDPMVRELNQQRFLLHRLVNDFEYHRFTRPMAYDVRELTEKGPREEVYGPAFDAMNEFVQKDMAERLGTTFQKYFQGKRFFAGTKQFEVTQISDLEVGLPWPRAYEVRLQFGLQAVEVPLSVQPAVPGEK
jgi:hypothetical protein